MTYRQTTNLKASELKDSTALTLMSTDVEKIATSLRMLHELWVSPIEVIVAICLLERQLGVSCLVPGLISLSG